MKTCPFVIALFVATFTSCAPSSPVLMWDLHYENGLTVRGAKPNQNAAVSYSEIRWGAVTTASGKSLPPAIEFRLGSNELNAFSLDRGRLQLAGFVEQEQPEPGEEWFCRFENGSLLLIFDDEEKFVSFSLKSYDASDDASASKETLTFRLDGKQTSKLPMTKTGVAEYFGSDYSMEEISGLEF